MKMCLTTLYNKNFEKFIPYVLKSFEKFCEINSFDICVYDKLFDTDRHPSWNKLLAVKESFKKYDLIFWCDADSLFTGKNDNFLKINNFDCKSDLMVSFDGNGICLSHFLINNNEYNIKLIDTLLFLKDVKDDNSFGIGPKWEQNTLKALIQHFDLKYSHLKQNVIMDIDWLTNSNDIFFYHYCCKSNELRNALIKKDYYILYNS
jgi:hypothetical protein